MPRHAKYMRIKNSRNPEDYYIWTEQLSNNDALEPYDGPLPPKITREGAIAEVVPTVNAIPYPTTTEGIQSLVDQLQDMMRKNATKISAANETLETYKDMVNVAANDMGNIVMQPEPEKSNAVEVPTISRIDAIKAVLPELNPENDYTKPTPNNGMTPAPRVAVVSEKVGFPVTSAEIKEAMQE